MKQDTVDDGHDNHDKGVANMMMLLTMMKKEEMMIMTLLPRTFPER